MLMSKQRRVTGFAAPHGWQPSQPSLPAGQPQGIRQGRQKQSRGLALFKDSGAVKILRRALRGLGEVGNNIEC